MKYISSLIMTLLLAACTAGPDYVRPTAITPAKFKEASKGWKIAKPNDHCRRGEWWKIFGDRKLNELERRLNISNQNIATAEAQYRQSLAVVDQVKSNYYPLISAVGTANRVKQPGNGVVNTGSGNISAGGTRNFYSVSLEAMWEPDLWGSVRRAVEASSARAESTEAQLEATRLLMQATLAQFYFQVRTLDLVQKVLDETVAAYARSLRLTKNRYEAGIAAMGDVVQAQSLLEVAKAQAIDNGVNRAKFEHAVAVLIGVPPSCFAMKPNPLNIGPPKIPLRVPSVLLERRPDIARAERLMAAANAEIGVAIAAYFPVLNLTASGSTQGPGLGPLFALPTIGWALGSQLLQTLADGGLRNATTQAARANYDATVATYRQTVLNAFQDVEDNLSTLRILSAEVKVQNRAVASARKAHSIILNQYKAGTVGIANVIIAETILYNAEKNAADIAGQRMVAAVGLIKALGGDWNGAYSPIIPNQACHPCSAGRN